MHRRRWRVILLLLLNGLAVSAALAQPGRAPRPGLPPAHSRLSNPGPTLGNPIDALKSLQLLHGNNLTPAQTQFLQQLLGKSAQDPIKPDEVWKMLDEKQHKGAAGAAKNAANEQMLDSMTGKNDEKQDSTLVGQFLDIGKKILQTEISTNKKSARASTPDGPVLRPNNPPPAPATGDANNGGEDRLDGKQLARWVVSMAERLKDEDSIWNKSPALQSALQDFGRLTAKSMIDRPPDDWGDSESALKWQDITRYLTPAKKADGSPGDPARDWSLPALGNVKMNAPNFSPAFRDLQSSFADGFAFNIRPGVLEGCIGGVLAVAIVMLALVWRRRRAGRARPGWRLGPWPVNPARIGSPDDLIAAFEYLALRDLGREAHAWNHRAVADGLGKRDERRQEAADDLAFLYERARYARDVAPLADQQLHEARHNLCFLAGVSRA